MGIWKKQKEKDLCDFLGYCGALEPIHIFGVAKLLGIDLSVLAKDEETEKGEFLLGLMVERFLGESKIRRRNLLGVLEEFAADLRVEKKKAEDSNVAASENCNCAGANEDIDVGDCVDAVRSGAASHKIEESGDIRTSAANGKNEGSAANESTIPHEKEGEN